MEFKTKRKLKDEVASLTYRVVAELEERLCPAESHDWVKVGREYHYSEFGICSTNVRCRCKRCGKTKIEYEY